VLGSEMYFPPDERAWADVSLSGLDPVMDLIRGRAAWISRYTSLNAGTQRLLVSLPIRHAEALKVLEAGIMERYATEGRVREDCRLASFTWKSFVIYILPGRGRLFVAVVPVNDSGGCDWARTADNE
jgi:hypothetical protein